MEDINKHHIAAYNNNPTALRHHKIITPALTSAAFILLAKKYIITTQDTYTKLGYDFLSRLNMPHFPIVNEIIDQFGTINTINGKIRPRCLENCVKTCLILAFG
jgi:hypothetical protein